MQNLNSSHSSSQRCGYLASTIGRKQIIGVTGIGLSLFVLIHMLENMLILVGARPYNEYAHWLITNPLIHEAEIILLLLFVVHLSLALALSWKNWRSRDTRYAMAANGPKRTSAVQKTLWAQGLIILVFVILHLITFKYGPYYTVNYGHGEIRDLHRLVLEVFRQPLFVAWYIVALIVLGFHLRHGVGSSFQTLGFSHPRYQPFIRCFTWAYALVVALGFITQPIYVYFIYRG